MNEDGVRASLRPRPRFLRRFLRRVAKAPASQAPSDGARAEPIARSVAQASSMVSRLRAVRTLKQFCKLMEWNLFQRPCSLAGFHSLAPAPGLFAMIESTQPVFIIGIYSRYCVQMADVVRLRSVRRKYVAVLSRAESVRQTELRDVGLHFKIDITARPQNRWFLTFERVRSQEPGQVADAQLARHMASSARSQAALPNVNVRQLPVDALVPTVVCPRKIKDHCKRKTEEGEMHAHRAVKSRTCHVLDVPLPRPMVLQDHVCRTCAERGNTGYQLASPTLEDVRDAFPGVLVRSWQAWGCIHDAGVHSHTSAFFLRTPQQSFNQACAGGAIYCELFGISVGGDGPNFVECRPTSPDHPEVGRPGTGEVFFTSGEAHAASPICI